MTSTFSVNRDQIITLALRKLLALEPGETPDLEDKEYANLNLNLMIKQWNTDGLKLWKVDDYVLPLTASVTSYTLGGASSATFYLASDATKTAVTDRPLKIVQSFLRQLPVSTTSVDIPLMIVSRQEYLVLGSKFSTGTTNSIYYQSLKQFGNLFVYLTPDTTTATDYELHFTAQMPLSDVVNPTDIPDFPNEWFNALVFGLADQMSLEYDVPLNHRAEIERKANTFKEALTSFDVESTSTFFTPDPRATIQRSGNIV